MDSTRILRGAPGSHEAPRQPLLSPTGSATDFISFGLFYVFPAFPPCSPLLPNFSLNPGESKELGKMPEFANLMPQPRPGPWRGNPILSPEHRTPLDRAAAALDYSCEHLKEENCTQTPEAGKSWQVSLDQKGGRSLSPEKPGLWGALGPHFVDLSGETMHTQLPGWTNPAKSFLLFREILITATSWAY